MRAAKAHISMRGNQVYYDLQSPNQTKFFMVMASFMDLHSILKGCVYPVA